MSWFHHLKNWKMKAFVLLFFHEMFCHLWIQKSLNNLLFPPQNNYVSLLAWLWKTNEKKLVSVIDSYGKRSMEWCSPTSSIHVSTFGRTLFAQVGFRQVDKELSLEKSKKWWLKKKSILEYFQGFLWGLSVAFSILFIHIFYPSVHVQFFCGFSYYC